MRGGKEEKRQGEMQQWETLMGKLGKKEGEGKRKTGKDESLAECGIFFRREGFRQKEEVEVEV